MSVKRLSFVKRLGVGRLGIVAATAAAAVAAPMGCGSRGDTGSEPAAETEAPKALPAFARLERNAHPLARPEFDLGLLDPAKRIENLSIVFKPSPAQILDRDALKVAQLDPGSPSFHQWLTPEEYAARFGAKAEDIGRVRDWLAKQGLEVKETSRLGTRVTFAGTVGKLQAAFQSEMHRYMVGGEAHFAMASAPAIPRELADVVASVRNTHDFFPKPTYATSRTKPLATCPPGGNCSGNGLAPPDWAAIYDVNKLYTTGINGTIVDGSGVSISIVGIAQIAQSDINAFRTAYGLPASAITMTLVPGTGVPQGENGAGLEAVLDIEWAGGIAKKANINYVYTGADDNNVDDAVYYAIEQNLAPILSESWGSCEYALTPADADLVETMGTAANLLGMTYLAASGDRGASSCAIYNIPGLYVNTPASFPGITAVGGTAFPAGSLTFTGGTATGYSTKEQAWNEVINGTQLSGGGGISITFPRPSYQSAIPTCTPVGSLPVTGITASNMREVPDLSAPASQIFIQCSLDPATNDCNPSGGSPSVVEVVGTSASTPAMAGVVALMNQVGGARLGNINPLLYGLESTTPSAFHDVTLGNNEMTCATGDTGCPAGKKYGYAAKAGYDCATGIGSPDVYNLISAVSELAPTTTALGATTTTTTEGTPVALTATIDVPKPNASALGGIVSFVFQSYLANGKVDLSYAFGSASISGGTTSAGTATLSVPIPVGLVNSGAQYVDVVAAYGGDAHHLPSTSQKVRIDFGPVGLCLTPTSVNLAVGAKQTFTAAGNVGAVSWHVPPADDSTCDSTGINCSSIDSAGVFTAGPSAGWALVRALDANGAETWAQVTVGAPTGTPPWAGDSGMTSNACSTESDAGVDAGHDSGTPDAGHDSGTPDAGHDSGTPDAGHDSGTPDAGHDSGTPDSGTDSGMGGMTDSGTLDSGSDTGSTGDDSGSTGDDSGSMGDDSGSMGDDSGSTGDDSGSTGDDSGATVTDSGIGLHDSGSYDSGVALNDSGAAQDSGEDAGDSSGGGGSSGCGCTTAGSDSGSPAGVFGGLALGFGLVVRRRRSKK